MQHRAVCWGAILLLMKYSQNAKKCQGRLPTSEKTEPESLHPFPFPARINLRNGPGLPQRRNKGITATRSSLGFVQVQGWKCSHDWLENHHWINRKYIFIPGGFSIAMLVLAGCKLSSSKEVFVVGGSISLFFGGSVDWMWTDFTQNVKFIWQKTAWHAFCKNRAIDETWKILLLGPTILIRKRHFRESCLHVPVTHGPQQDWPKYTKQKYPPTMWRKELVAYATGLRGVKWKKHLGISKNMGTPKSSILIGFSTINHPFSGTPIFGNTHIFIFKRCRATSFVAHSISNWNHEPLNHGQPESQPATNT